VASPGGDGQGGASAKGALSAAFVLSSHERILMAHFVATAASPAASQKARTTVIGSGASVVALWSFKPERGAGGVAGASPRTVAPIFTVSAEALGGRVLCARPAIAAEVPGGTATGAIVAFGPAGKPSFARLGAPAERGGDASVEVFATPEGAGEEVAAADKAKAAVAAEATVLGPLEVAVARNQPQRKRANDRAAETEEGAASAKFQRLGIDAASGGVRAPGGISIAPPLRQALRSKDRAALGKLLEQHSKNERLIISTASDLSGAEAFDLLQECTAELVAFPLKGKGLCMWVTHVLTIHCAFISSQPVLHRALQPLLDVMQTRCSNYRTLTKLQGRLKLLHSVGRQLLQRRQAEREIVQEPLLDYKEGDDDVDEEVSSEGGDEAAAEDDASGLDSDEDLFADDSDDI